MSFFPGTLLEPGGKRHFLLELAPAPEERTLGLAKVPENEVDRKSPEPRGEAER